MRLSSVFADRAGNILIDEALQPLGAAGDEFWELTPEDLIPLPSGSDLFFLPGRKVTGLNASTGDIEVIDDEDIMPVAAILPQGYTRLLLPAYQRGEAPPPLPLFGYTAVAAKDEDLCVAALQTDYSAGARWNPVSYNTPELRGLIEEKINKHPKNRVLKHLSHCALNYHCLTAQNIFYRRWEGGVPVSPTCNAECLGCISKQPAGCCPSPQGRIKFHPTIEEITEIVLPHLESEEAIISFGQGCEGEPLLAWKVISEVIRRVRAETERGTININTNAGLPMALENLAEAGLDSARVSVFSANPDNYGKYHRPKNYDLSEVAESVDRLIDKGVYVSLNLLVFPGFTDYSSEQEALFEFLHKHQVNMVQLRNLNIDPDLFKERIGYHDNEVMYGARNGVANLLNELQAEFPRISVGNFSRALR